MSTERSVGQGNLRSPRTLSPAGSSIVQRLAKRSISGRGLNVRVHQHHGWRLHLEWTDGHESRRCFQRYFTSLEAVDTFCAELMRGGAEGVCECIGDCPDLFQGKVNVCWLNRPVTPLPDISRYWIRQIQEWNEEERYKCLCPVSSTEWVISDIEWRKQI